MADEWEIFVDNAPERSEFLTSFTPQSRITGKRRLKVDHALLLKSCGLAKGTTCGLIVAWFSTGTARRDTIVQEIGLAGHDGLFELDFSIEGGYLAGALELRTQVVVLQSAISDLTGRALPPGAVLWDDKATLRLTGHGSQFPIEMVDFEKLLLPRGAAWLLDWHEGEWDRPVLGHLRLLVNSQALLIANAVQTSEPTVQDRLILKMMQVDVARSMITAALQDESFVSRLAWDEDSTGEVVQRLIRGLFGDTSSALQVYRQSAASLAAEIQSKLVREWK